MAQKRGNLRLILRGGDLFTRDAGRGRRAVQGQGGGHFLRGWTGRRRRRRRRLAQIRRDRPRAAGVSSARAGDTGGGWYILRGWRGSGGQGGGGAAQAAGRTGEPGHGTQTGGAAAGAAGGTISQRKKRGKGTVNRGGLLCGCGERRVRLIFSPKKLISFRWMMAEGWRIRYNKGKGRGGLKGGGADDRYIG